MPLRPSIARVLCVLACALLVCVVVPATAAAVTVSGTAMRDEVGTVWQGCDGVTANVALRVAPAAPVAASCSPTTGAFAFGGVTVPAVGAPLVVWFDGAPAAGVEYHTAASTSADVTTLQPTQDRVRISSSQVNPTVGRTLLDGWDSTNDTDIPVTADSSVVLPASAELHLQGAVTFDPGTAVVAGSVHVGSSASYDAKYTPLTLLGHGTSGDCTLGPGASAPLCLTQAAPAGTMPSPLLGYFRPAAGARVAVAANVVYNVLDLAGHADADYLFGTAAGGTISGYSLVVDRAVVTDPWNPALDFDNVRVNTGGSTTGSITGLGAFAFSVHENFSGNGEVDLPGVDLQFRSTTPAGSFGHRWQDGPNDHHDWTFRSVELSNGGIAQLDFGVTGTASSPSYNSSGTNADTAAAIAVNPYNGSSIVAWNQPTGGGDWGLARYWEFGYGDDDWDDGDVGYDGDANGSYVKVFNSGGADTVTSLLLVDEPGCSLPQADRRMAVLVGGQWNGQWGIRKYDCHGRIDTSWNGSGIWIVATAGTVRSMVQTAGGNILVGGDMNNGWRVQLLGPNAASLNTALTWNGYGGGVDTMSMMCTGGYGRDVYVVGRSEGDWAVGRLSITDEVSPTPPATNNDYVAWQRVDGTALTAPFRYDAGGTLDTAQACASDGWRTYVAGSSGNGSNDDIRAIAFDLSNDGTRKYDWGTSNADWTDGQYWAPTSAVHDRVASIVHDGLGGIRVVGSDATNGGRMTMYSIDWRGRTNESIGTNGLATWDPTGGNEQGLAAAQVFGSNIVIAMRDAANGGDVRLRSYDVTSTPNDGSSSSDVRVDVTGTYSSSTTHTIGDFRIGRAGDSAGVVVDTASSNGGLDVGGELRLLASSALRANEVVPIRIRGNLSILGRFFAHAGKIVIEGPNTKRSVVDVANDTTVHDLTVATPGKTVVMDATDRLQIDGAFRALGASCAQPVTFRSSAGGDDWKLNGLAGATASIQYARFVDMTFTPGGATSTNTWDGGGNSGIGFTSPCGAITNAAPDTMQVDGVADARSVSGTAPVLSFVNRAGNPAANADVEVYSSNPVSNAALWRFDDAAGAASGVDASGNGRNLAPATSVASTTGRFAEAANLPAANGGYSLAAGLPLPGDYTIDGWFSTNSASTSQRRCIVCNANPGFTQVNYGLYFEPSSPRLTFLTTGVSGGWYCSLSVDSAPLADGRFHHVAVSYRDTRCTMFVDGVMRGGDSAFNTPAHTNASWPVQVGTNFDGRLDDVRISTVGEDVDTIRGYYRAGRRHLEKVWDSDPADTVNGTVIGGTYGTGARAPVTYGGAVGSLQANGARYWVRAKFSNGAGAPTEWSTPDWFDTTAGITLALPSGGSYDFGPISPGVDSTMAVPVQVTTSNRAGYSLWVRGDSDTVGLASGLATASGRIPRLGAPGDAPQPWNAGASGLFGLSVLSATGSKDTSRWGAGTLANQYGSLLYASPSLSKSLLLHSRAAYDASTQNVALSLRVNPSPTQRPGRYSTRLEITAIPNV